MPKKSERGFTQVVFLLILLIGIVLGVVYLKDSKIFRGRASEDFGPSYQDSLKSASQSTNNTNRDSTPVLRSEDLTGDKEQIDSQFDKRIVNFSGPSESLFSNPAGIDTNSYSLYKISTLEGTVYEFDIKPDVFSGYFDTVWVDANYFVTASRDRATEAIDGNYQIFTDNIHKILMGQSARQLRENPQIALFLHTGAIKKDYLNAINFSKLGIGPGGKCCLTGSLSVSIGKSTAAKIDPAPDYNLEYESSNNTRGLFKLSYFDQGYFDTNRSFPDER